MFPRPVFGSVSSGDQCGIMRFLIKVEGVRVRFVCLTSGRSFPESLSPPECHDHHSRHVDRGKQSCQRANGPKQFAKCGTRQTESAGAPRLPKDLILGKKAGKDWDSGNREPAGQHGGESDWHVLLQPSHPSHILLVMHPVYYRAGAEEEKGLEECVGDHMKNRGDESADAARQKHVTKLRDS